MFLQENVAVAVEFGYYRNLDGVFSTPQVVVFANMGCVAATLTAVEYKKVRVHEHHHP